MNREEYLKQHTPNGTQIIRKYNEGNYTEYVCDVNGDYCTFRVYGSNPENYMITER